MEHRSWRGNDYRAAQWAVLIDEWRRERARPAGVLSTAGAQPRHDAGLGLQARAQNAADRIPPRLDGQVKAARSSHEVAPPVPSPAFLPVRLAEVAAPSPEPAGRAAIEVVLGGGRRVVVGPGFDAETLRRVVAALEG